MKKILLIGFVALAAASCSKFLEEDPKGRFMGESFFQSVKDIENVMTSLEYNVANFYYDGCSYNMSVRSDDMTSCNAGGMGMELCTVPSSEYYLQNHWDNAYKIIREANAFLQSVPSVTTNTPEDEKLLKNLEGYAYFFRGWGYSLIARWYKQGPIVESVGEGVDYKSKSQKALLEYSVSQLLKAEELLPDTWEGHRTEKEAPMKITAKAALAEMYLFMAGYPYNGGKEYYSKAAAKAKEVIDAAPALGRGFDTYDNMWNTNDPLTNLNKERLFSIYFSQYGFRCASTTCFFPGEYAGWDWILGEKQFYRDFPEGPRKEATFMTTRQNTQGQIVSWDDPSLVNTQPVYRKKILNPEDDFDNLIGRTTWQNSYMAMPLRYTLTALTYAEAVTRATGAPDALAKDLMHQIRERAGLEDYDASLTGDAYAKAVVQERAWEMAAEWTRWNDICRLEMFEEVFAHRAADEKNASSGLGTPNKASYFLDVPPTDLALNPNLAEVED